MPFRLSLSACLFLSAFSLLAASITQSIAGPAPWYQWRSKVDGRLSCSQIPLGPGWERAAGPFRDSHCEKRMFVK